MVFDVLELGGKDLRKEPLRKRRKLLEELVVGARMILPARRLSDNGLKAWTQAVHRGYEGMVGKDPESPYVPGRTLKWLKVKVKDYRKEERGFGVAPGSWTVHGFRATRRLGAVVHSGSATDSPGRNAAGAGCTNPR